MVKSNRNSNDLHFKQIFFRYLLKDEKEKDQQQRRRQVNSSKYTHTHIISRSLSPYKWSICLLWWMSCTRTHFRAFYFHVFVGIKLKVMEPNSSSVHSLFIDVHFEVRDIINTLLRQIKSQLISSRFGLNGTRGKSKGQCLYTSML